MQKLLNVLSPHGPAFPDSIRGVINPQRHLQLVGTVAMFRGLQRPIQILEIGSWLGESMLSWAEAIAAFLPEKKGGVLCVDAWQPFFEKRDVTENPMDAAMDASLRDEISYPLFLHNAKFAAPGVAVNHFRGKSRDVLPYLADKSFDIIYIDADHSYPAVSTDVQQAIRLVAEGGIVCGDDMEMQLPECADAARNMQNRTRDFVTDPVSGKGFHPGVTLAVYEQFGPVSCYAGYWLMRRVLGSFQQVDMNGLPTFIPAHERAFFQ